MMRYKIMLSYILISLFIFNIIPISFDNNLKADQVSWENEYGKLTVYPSVSKNLIRQKQYYNITWYKPDDNIDIAFRFENPLSYGKVYYWDGSNYSKISIDHIVYNGKHYYVVDNIHFNQYETRTGYWEYDTPVRSNGKWDMFIKLSSDSWVYAFNNNRYVHLDPWWNSNWLYKKRITIDKDQIVDTLENFTIPINLSSDPELATNVGYSNGSDIAFVDSTETKKLSHEIELFDDGTGKLVSWVKIPILSSTVDTVIYMYYGNNNCANQTDISGGTWDSNYTAVYHMSGSGWSDIVDSTSHGLDATGEGSSPIYNQDCIIGSGVSFDGGNDYINLVDSNLFTFSSGTHDVYYTIEAICKKTDNNINPVISKYSTAPNTEWFLSLHNDNKIRMYMRDSGASKKVDRYSSDTVDNSGFHYIVGLYNATGVTTLYENVLIYLDGQNNSGAGSKDAGYLYMRNQNQIVRIGVYGSEYFKGYIDEIRISKGIAFNESWIETTYNSIFNASDGFFFTLGDEESIGNIERPTGFIASTDIDGNIDVNWTLGLNSTITRVEYNIISSWARGTGTLLYNGSGLTASLTATTCGVRYYFRAWGFNVTQNNWSIASNCSNISCPDDPTNLDVDSYPTLVNFTWVNNTYATSTLVVRKNNGYPSSPSDGTILYNGTNKYYEDSGVVYGTTYYRLFSYNSTVNRFSSGINAPISSLKVNVFDENTSIAIVNWSIYISNEAGTQVYDSPQNNNTLIIDTGDLPLGDITIIINATGYDSKIFSMTIEANNIYTLDAYLSSLTSTEQYIITVVGPENEYGYLPPISDATLNFKRYVNGSYESVSILKTSSTGTVYVKLIPEIPYHVTVTATDYETLYLIFIPPPIEYNDDRYHTFRMTPSNISIPTYDIFWDDITFTAVMVDAGYMNLGNITITYNDSNLSTVDTDTYLYEIYNGTITLVDTHNQNSDSYSQTVGNINTTRLYYIKLYFNNTATYSDQTSPVTVNIPNIYTYIVVTPFDLNQRITNLVGPEPIEGTEYSDYIAIVLPIIILVSLGVFNASAGIVGCGISMGLVQSLYFGYGIAINVLFVALCPFVIVIGFIHWWATREEGQQT